MSTVSKVVSACAVGAVLASGCVNSNAVTGSTSHNAPVVGYADRIAPPRKAEAPRPSTSARIPAGQRTASASNNGHAETRPLGRAPHICTPSGFGRTSTCYSRT
jgi:hypothetical protein